MKWLICLFYFFLLIIVRTTFGMEEEHPVVFIFVIICSLFVGLLLPFILDKQKNKYERDINLIRKNADEEIMKNNRNSLLEISKAQKSAELYCNKQLKQYEQRVFEIKTKAEARISETIAEFERLEKTNVFEIDKLFTHLKNNVSSMDGKTYEAYVGYKISNNGWHNITYTPITGDYGADIIATDKDGNRVCIQCKRYDHPVGIDAVQEVIAAKQFYGAKRAIVATNSVMTAQARNMAQKTDVELWEHFV